MENEKRDLRRWELSCPARIRLRYKNSAKSFECIIKNINFKGFHACLKKELPSLETLKLTVVFPSNDSFTAKTKVAWKKVLNDGILYGFDIIAMKDNQRDLIYKLVDKNYHSDLVKIWWQDTK